MSIFKPLGKAAKFTFVTIPLGIFGWQLNKGIFLWGRSLWKRAINPECPSCDHGNLFLQKDQGPVVEELEGGGVSHPLYPWICSHCGFSVLESSNPKNVRAFAGQYRMERARAAFSDMEFQERQHFSIKHRNASRIFFVFALLLFVNTLFLLVTGSALMMVLNWGSFAFMFFIFGMKRSYRSWQVLSGHIFKEGAAHHWFKHEKWLI